MSSRLYVRYRDTLVGTYERDADGLQIFRYQESWVENPNAFSLSIALRLQTDAYRGKVVQSFFENLIPEANQRRQLEMIAGLPEGDDVAFLEHFGEDCAGALTISSRLDQESVKVKSTEPVFVVEFETIEQTIAEGISVQSVLEQDGELPPFSLAGAQAKFPCIVRDEKILMPRAGIATSHIVKLPIRAGEKLLDSVQNEFICMRLAAVCGLNVPSVDLIGKNIKLFVIERFDRQLTAGKVERLHTQDFCQALGRPSSEKYERHGGPTFAECYRLLADHSLQTARDQMRLLDWLSFNLVIGNNDSHAKNLSFVYQANGVQLAPLYDLLCTAIYKQFNAEFAFKIGDTTSWQKIRPKHIEAFARHLGITPAFMRKRWLEMFQQVKEALAQPEEQIIGSVKDPETRKTLRKLKAEISKRLPELNKYTAQKLK